MKTTGFGSDVHKVDHVTLLAMASDIADFISGDLAEEAQKAIEKARNPSKIIQVRP